MMGGDEREKIREYVHAHAFTVSTEIFKRPPPYRSSEPLSLPKMSGITETVKIHRSDFASPVYDNHG